MKPARNRSTWCLFLCVVLGIHNRRARSRIGVVHYCSRCGMVTADDRRQGMAIADASRFIPGMPIVFGDPGREYRGIVERVDLEDSRLVLSRIRLIPKWQSRLRELFVMREVKEFAAYIRRQTIAGGK